jgi:HSP20 family protein
VSQRTGGSRARQMSGGGSEERRDVKLVGSVTLLDLSDKAACMPPSDVTEVEDALRILLELPGVPASEVNVWVRGGRIEVTGEKPPDFPKGNTSFICLERTFGRYCRVFEVMGPLNLGQVSARLKNGILVITIPKVAERRGRERRIPVTVE